MLHLIFYDILPLFVTTSPKDFTTTTNTTTPKVKMNEARKIERVCVFVCVCVRGGDEGSPHFTTRERGSSEPCFCSCHSS